MINVVPTPDRLLHLRQEKKKSSRTQISYTVLRKTNNQKIKWHCECLRKIYCSKQFLTVKHFKLQFKGKMSTPGLEPSSWYLSVVCGVLRLSVPGYTRNTHHHSIISDNTFAMHVPRSIGYISHHNAQKTKKQKGGHLWMRNCSLGSGQYLWTTFLVPKIKAASFGRQYKNSVFLIIDRLK